MNARAPGVVEFHRPARVHPEPLDPRPVNLAAPPTVPQESQGSILQIFLPMVGSATMVGFAILYNNRAFLYIAIGIAVLMLTVGIAMRVQTKRSVKKRRRKNAQRYRAYLADMQSRLEERTRRQHEYLLRLYPGIDGVWSVVNERRVVWERRPWDPDFMVLRLGLGTLPLAAPVSLEITEDPLVEYEHDLLEEANLVFERFKSLSHAPVTIDARQLGPLAVVGGPEAVRGWTRSVLVAAATHHAPDDLRMVAYFPQHTMDEWGWLKWVPHARGSIEPLDDAHQSVALAVDTADFEVLLSQLITGRIEHVDRLKSERRGDEVRFQQVIVVVDDLDPSGVTGLEVYEEMLRRSAEIGVLPIVLVSDSERVPTTVGARVQLEEGGWLGFVEAGPEGRRESEVRADSAGVDVCEAIARALAPLRLKVRDSRTRQVDSEGLLDLLHLGTPHAIASERWRKRTPELLRTPIGIGEDGSQVVLDLKESAEEGMGPHGLIVGATGSGKSELLRTLVTGLAVGHSPDDLAMVLVDFKGGATFGELSRLPHTAGMITNIERDLTLVDRMHEALFGELERRQRVLQEAGNFDRVRDYQEHRRQLRSEQELPPLPSLLVIIDEFGELLAHKPDFIDLFVSMGRTGRSLGVHLLLSTQRLETGRIRGLESHLRYRICLRTFSPEESQEVLGARDAFELPPLPGLGYLSVDGRLRQFKAALSTRPFREYRDLETQRPVPGVVRSFSLTRDTGEIAVVGHATEPDAEAGKPAPSELRTEMQVCVDRLEELVAFEQRARQVWLAPLPAAMTLDEIVDPEKREDRAPGALGWLEAAVGLEDRPREQMQLPMTIGFGGREGHCAIVGAPRSGKSTLLQTLAASLALTHDPHDVQLYALDFGGGALHSIAELPHVGAVYSRSERAEVARLVREMRSIVDNRTELFRKHHIASMSEFHAGRHAGALADDYGEV
ncbi:MAG: type VII secretion protein EccCa, partial [Actinomycetota bacterium]